MYNVKDGGYGRDGCPGDVTFKIRRLHFENVNDCMVLKLYTVCSRNVMSFSYKPKSDEIPILRTFLAK